MKLREHDYIPTQKELLRWIMQRRKYSKTERDQALLSTLYMTGARVGEIVGQLRPENMEKIQSKGMKYMVFSRVITEKKKDGTVPRRNIPVPINMNEEEKFLEILEKYIKKYNIPLEHPIFDISTTRAYQITNEWLSNFKEKSPMSKNSSVKKVSFMDGCHYLRHVRSTHLAVLYDFTGQHMKEFHNWSSSAQSDKYTHLNVTNLMDKFKKSTE